jgi:cell wall-associated NlpC family hydrolase
VSRPRAGWRDRGWAVGILGHVRRRGLIGLAGAAALAVAGAGCGSSLSSTSASGTATSASATATRAGDAPAAPKPHPQAVEPVAGAGGAIAGGSTAQRRAGVVSVSGAGSSALAQPVSLSQVRSELSASGMSAAPDQATLTSDGLAVAPVGAPAAVQEVIAAGNQIAHLPYVWGGGHLRYEDTGYDCSGSLSYVLAAAHLLEETETSGQLESWGKAGPGKWITVFATAGHTFMYVAGLRFDTVALAETGTRWSASRADEPDAASFVVRHPAGL